MDPAAQGSFLASAIPVKGDNFFGTSGRAAVQGTGSSAGLKWTANPFGENVGGAVQVEATQLDSTDLSGSNARVTQAYLQWDRIFFGIADSAFADHDCLCEYPGSTRPHRAPVSIHASQPQVGVMVHVPDNFADDPTGWYIYASIEEAQPDLLYYPPKSQVYEGYSRYPDFTWYVRHMTKEASVASYLQFSSVLRDLAIDQQNSAGSNTTGWGLQLSGAYKILIDPCCSRWDTALTFL